MTYTYYSDAKGTKVVKPADVKNAKTYYVQASLAADKNHKSAKSNLAKFTIKKKVGALTCKLVSVKNKKFKKYFKVNAKTGKITIKKGLKKGTYTITVSVKAKGNSNYKALTKKLTFKIVVK